MIMFPESVVKQFRHTNKHLRYGQQFHQFMKLEKVRGQDKNFCDKLYNADEQLAKQLISSRTQKGQ